MENRHSRHKDNSEKIPVRCINGQPYIRLKYAIDYFNKIEQQNVQIGEDMKKLIEKKFDEISRLTFEMGEFNVPHFFIVLPVDTPHYNPVRWLYLNYRLYFLCECENHDERHFAFHDGYEIKKPREFFRKYGHYLRKMLTFVKCAISVGSMIVPQLLPVALGISKFSIPKDRFPCNNFSTLIERLEEILTEVEKDHNISTKRDVQYVEGSELRGIESFLKKVDEHRTFGNLHRTVTNDGHVRWVCIQHCNSDYSESVKKNLRINFQKLGGEVKGDEAIIQRKEASNKFLKMVNLLREGLPVFSIILKDLNLKEEDFDILLDHVSRQSVIRNLGIENITVSRVSVRNHGMLNIKKRDIILRLDNAVRKNNNLKIQYSFTKSLSKFAPELIHTIITTNSRLVFHLRSQEVIPSIELAGTKETGFTLTIGNSDVTDDIHYTTAIENIFSMELNITKIHLHNGVISKRVWTSFYQFLTIKQSLQELAIDCRLTLEQTEELSSILSDNRTLKTLHLFNIWERMDEFEGFEKIFEMLSINETLIEFTLTCHTDQLRLDFVAKHLLQNKSLQVIRLPKCQVRPNTNVKLCEEFLQTTSIEKLSLELISTNCEGFLERLARALDKNEKLEILELKGLDCSAIFYRKEQIPDSENNVIPSSPVQISERSSQGKLEKFLALFSCHRSKQRHHSHEEIILPPVVSAQKNNRKYVSTEPFYALCNHPSFYKQIQEITQYLSLEELQVTLGADVQMTNVASCIKSNLTVTRLKIDRRILTENDIAILVEALRDNIVITHLSLNEINISMTDFRQIFGALHHDRILRVLEVRHCISHFDRDLFIQEIKTLESINPYLKVVYENQ